jgi:hypothetical protein
MRSFLPCFPLAAAVVLAAPALQAASTGSLDKYVVQRIAIAKPMTLGLLGNASDVNRIEVRSGADGALGKDADGRVPVLNFRNTAYSLEKEGTYVLRVYGNPLAFNLGFFWGLDKTNAKYGFRIKSGAGGTLAVESQSHADALRDADINRNGLLVNVP